MEFITASVILIVGMVLLIKGADWFVDGASGLATRLGISTLVIGLTIVAFGTSAPEAAVSISSALKGSSGIALGNVVGSNLFNLLVVVGSSAIFRPVIINKSIMKKDYPFSLLATVVLLFTMMDSFFGDLESSMVSRTDGLVILSFFSIFMFYTVSGAVGEGGSDTKAKEKKPLTRLLPMLIIGIAAIIAGGQMVVNGASNVARSLGVSETLIGLTIVAIGTSLPELVTSVVATRKGEDDIAMGNVIGSNIFNILFIIGIGAAIEPMPVDRTIIADCMLLLSINLAFYAFVFKNARVNKAGGLSMIAIYAGYIVYAILR